jgi:hypothetical protein
MAASCGGLARIAKLAALSVLLVLPVTRHTAAMAEVRYTSTFDLQREPRLVVNFGLMRCIRYNVVLYANVGRSVFSDEGIRHIYVGVGVKFLPTPNAVAGKK